VLVHVREEELDELAGLEAAIAPFATLDRLEAEGVAELCPLLKTGPGGAVAGLADRTAIRLDSDALLQGFTRALRHAGGELVTGANVQAIRSTSGGWQADTADGRRFTAPLLVNAGGAWADVIASLAGARPLGLTPLKRTIITFDAPAGTNVERLPFAKTVGDELYFAPESGRLFASPMDEVPSEPCDAQPDEYEVALAAHRVEERTTVSVRRIHHRWAGLRTFAPDRHPVVGFDPGVPGLFWLAGQGGFGLQTSPVLARATAALIAGADWPVADVAPEALSPARFG
jgi:D-arginine dehydrogenase